MSASPLRPRWALLLLVGGFAGWSVTFVLLYALLSLGCAYGWDGIEIGPLSLQRLVLLGAWAACLGVLLALVILVRRLFEACNQASRFLLAAGLALTAASAGSTAWNFVGVTLLSTCL